MNKRYLFFVLLSLSVTVFLFARGTIEKESEPVPVVQVSGVVRMVGSSLFPEIVISGEYEWYVAAEERDKLSNLQHMTVTVEGEETIRELTFANGQSAGIRRELHNIRIITED